MSNALDDLGLGNEAVAEVQAPAVEVAEAVASEISFGALPGMTRAGRKGKYRFNELGAPVKGEDGAWGYSSFTVKNADEKAKRSVQSATTQANKSGAATGKHFVSRSVPTGIAVYRVDATLKAEAPAA